MAFLDIASNSSYGRYNRKFAHIAGLEAAIYWSEILEILGRVLEKKTFDSDGWFVLDREYVKKQTTFDKAKQREIEEILSGLQILETSKDNENKIRCDVKAFTAIICEEDVSTVKEIKAVAKQQTKEAKKAAKKNGVICRLTSLLAESKEVTEKYRAFLDVAYEKGLQQNARFSQFVSEINAFTQDDSVKIKLLEIGIEKAYAQADWIINCYSRNASSRSIAPQKVATKLSDVEL